MISTLSTSPNQHSSYQRESNGTFDCIGMNTISYSRHIRESQLIASDSFNTSSSLQFLHAYDKQWAKNNFPPPPPSRFSNKIVLVVDCSTLQVIHMNDIAARILFNCERQLKDNIRTLDKIIPDIVWMKKSLDACHESVGAVIVATSDLIDIVDFNGDLMTVSAFVQKLTRPKAVRCIGLFAFERCYRFSSKCTINKTGEILKCDSHTMSLFGRLNMDQTNIEKLLNNVTIDSLTNSNGCLYVTGRNIIKDPFPISVFLKDANDSEGSYQLEMQVYTNLSGLVIIDQNATVIDCNCTFLRLFLGHGQPRETVINKSIKTLIPQFSNMTLMHHHHDDSASDINDSICAARLTNSVTKDIFNSGSIQGSPPRKRRRALSGCGDSPAKQTTLAREVILRVATKSVKSEDDFPTNGHYHCKCLHSDGTLLDSECLVSQIEDDKWALWISRSGQDPHTVNLMLDSVPKDIMQSNGHLENVESDYFNHYDNYVELQPGRLGPVFLAKKLNSAGEETFVTKFYTKSDIQSFDMCDNMVREAFALSQLQHPNIVELVNNFEDKCFYQVVVRHHGMDLINFLALNPDMDEQLCSFIFRQLVDAVNYLHSNEIVHRNIRAENVVIDKDFNAKLIDFSHCHFKDFDNLPFVGNLDYCPPEILHGLSNYGKPTDIWSLGVTLFMIMFGFLPFKEPYSIIRNIRLLPNLTSDQMAELFSDVFCPMPESRITSEQLSKNSWVRQNVDIQLYRWVDVVKRGDFQTHIDYQEFQANPQATTDLLYDDSPKTAAYEGCSPVMRIRERSIDSILNKTINIGDQETVETNATRTISSFMRSLSNMGRDNDEAIEQDLGGGELCPSQKSEEF